MYGRVAGRCRGGRRRVLAVDGKTLRGSRHTGSDGVEVVGRHLLAVIDQHTRVVLGQLGVDGKTSEINRFAPLLDTLTDPDLAGAVITAHALHPTRPRRRATCARLALGAEDAVQPDADVRSSHAIRPMRDPYVPR
jgi:hypothetical protein